MKIISMLLRDQCCTIQQAKRLKELGVRQDSLFSWYYPTDRDDEPSLNKSRQYDCPTCGHPNTPYFAEVSAFTIAELLQALPDQIKPVGNKTTIIGELYLHKGYDHYAEEDTWVCGYKDSKEWIIGMGTANAVESCASCLIHLLETGMVTVDEVNKRLGA